MSGCAKNYILKKDTTKKYTSTLEQYDYIPYFNIKNKNPPKVDDYKDTTIETSQ